MTLHKILVAFASVLGIGIACASAANASPCVLPNILTNGQVADASQVMDNFNAVTTCLTNNGTVNTGTTGQVGYYSANGNAISGESLSNLLDSTFGSTQGSILYRSSTAWQLLPPGTAGDLLKSGGAGADPAWGSGTGAIGAVPYFGATGGTWTRPAGTAFSWVNQGSSTYTDYPGGRPLVVTTPASGGDSLALLCVPAPGGNFTYTAMITTPGLGSSYYTAFGLALYDSESGKVTTLGFSNGAANVLHWTSVTSYSNTLKTITWYGNLMWVRITSDGATLTYSISIDGIDWMQFASEGLTAFMPAITNICWGGNSHDNDNSGLSLHTELWQWTSP